MLHAVLLALAIGSSSPAQTNKLSAADRIFLTKAAMANTYEIRAAQLAQGHSSSDADKQFAQMMIADHTRLGQEVAAAVARNDPTFTLPAGVSARQQAMLNRLRRSGKGFAAEYRRQMLATHNDAKTLFIGYTGTAGVNPDIKAVISRAVPTVQQHLTQAGTLPGR